MIEVKEYRMFEISDHVLKATTKCKKGFSCLSGERKDLCKISYCVSNEIYFLNHCNDTSCGYAISFGYSYVCTCPTRKEIYNRFNQ
ncbi:MAG TPA: hypothetical protein EYP21_03835 [Syntrophaceae bacterium]|nr:hypothetical protein [Syntrophaceae bacterium]